MNDIKKAKVNLLNMLERSIDQVFLKNGFTRRKGSLIYKRKLPGSVQEVDFIADFYPKCEASAEAHIHPVFVWKIPSVSVEALKLVADNKILLANAPDILLKQPIEICAPIDLHERWFPKNQGDYLLIGGAICAFIETWLFDFLESLQGIDDLLMAYESSDDRLLKQQHWYIYVVAAYLLKEEKEKARLVMDKHLGNPGLRKRYASVYDYL